MTLFNKRSYLLLLFGVCLSACDGGGGTPAAQAPPPTLSSDASLSSMSVTGETLDPEVSAAATNYTATVPKNTNSVGVTVTAITSDGNASFTINGSDNATVALAVGDNAISIVVTAENGTTTRTYTIVVTLLTFAQEAYIKASNTDAFDLFGGSVSLSGDAATHRRAAQLPAQTNE